MLHLLRKRPWLLVCLAFALLIAAWVTLMIVAKQHPMEPIPVPKAGAGSGAAPQSTSDGTALG